MTLNQLFIIYCSIGLIYWIVLTTLFYFANKDLSEESEGFIVDRYMLEYPRLKSTLDGFRCGVLWPITTVVYLYDVKKHGFRP